MRQQPTHLIATENNNDTLKPTSAFQAKIRILEMISSKAQIIRFTRKKEN